MIPIEEWIGNDGFLRLHHKDSPRHNEWFSDCIDSTAIWLTSEFMNGWKKPEDILQILYKGFEKRTTEDDEILRHPTSTTPVKRDQLDFLVPLIRACGMRDNVLYRSTKVLADMFVERYGGRMLPHWSDHFWNEDSWLGRAFECGDSISDWFSNSESSQMNNIARLLWGAYLGKRNGLAIDLFKRKIDPWYVMVVYGSRWPESQEFEYPLLFKMATEDGATVDDPPPIYRGYKELFKEFL